MKKGQLAREIIKQLPAVLAALAMLIAALKKEQKIEAQQESINDLVAQVLSIASKLPKQGYE